jgi:hypothetical protein
MSAIITKTFYDWCVENNRQDLLDRWDYELNQCSPKDVGFSVYKKYYFKCPRGLHNSMLHKLNNISNSKAYPHVKCKECSSIGQYLIDIYGNNAFNLYWDYEKNIGLPWEYEIQSDKYIWIKCQEHDYHGSYKVSCSSFYNGSRCPYCRGLKVHPKDSFAQYHIDNTDKDFLKKYWSDKNQLNPWKLSVKNNKTIYIKCQSVCYHEDYKTTCSMFSFGYRCPYCSLNSGKIHKLDSLGTLYPQVFEIWSDRNKKSPYEYAPKSHCKIYWKCSEGKHKDYLRSIKESNDRNFRCPNCTRERNESFLQEKVRLYLSEELGYKLNHEYECTLIPQNPKYIGSQGMMPFDNEVIDLKLVIEVMGIQHYNTNSYSSIWKDDNLTPEQQLHKRQLYDRYKRYIAFRNGYFYLAIPYWTEKDESYKQLIDNKIQEIILSKVVNCNGYLNKFR